MTVRRLDLGDGGESALFRLYFIETGHDGDVNQFLEKLAHTDPDEFAGTVEYLDRVAQHGLLKNEEKSRFLDKKLRIFELKSGRVRIPAFWDKNRLIICANAFFKDAAKTKKNELRRAQTLKKQYDYDKNLNQVTFKE